MGGWGCEKILFVGSLCLCGLLGPLSSPASGLCARSRSFWHKVLYLRAKNLKMHRWNKTPDEGSLRDEKRIGRTGSCLQRLHHPPLPPLQQAAASPRAKLKPGFKTPPPQSFSLLGCKSLKGRRRSRRRIQLSGNGLPSVCGASLRSRVQGRGWLSVRAAGHAEEAQ